MKKYFLLLLLAFLPFFLLAQLNKEYTDGVNKAMAYYESKEFLKAANEYAVAFAALGGKASSIDRYNAACAWSKAGNKDSAFFHLNRLVTKAKFIDYDQMKHDKDFKNLHGDKRWTQMLALVKQNREKAEINLNKPLVALLDSVFRDDQGGRMQLDNISRKYGQNSKELKNLWKEIKEKDSIDLIKVKKVLDVFGWLGADVVGMHGNTTLFLVVQHANIKVQEIYLPMMREAVKNNKANPSDLALLEDRVALGEGRKQIYGSQVRFDSAHSFWVSPLEDPDNVDKRRAEVGLQPLADYLKNWNMKWDMEAYKKQLPEIEARGKNIDLPLNFGWSILSEADKIIPTNME